MPAHAWLRFFSAPAPTDVDPRVRRWARIASALIFASSVSVAAVNRHIPADNKGILNRLAFAESVTQVKSSLTDDLIGRVYRANRDDSLLLVPVYWAVFTVSGVVLLLSCGRVNRTFGSIVIVSITVAAACDLRENSLIMEGLRDGGADGVPASWARFKWLFFFLSTFALSAPLLSASPHRDLHHTLTGLLLAIAGLLGLWLSAFDHTGISEAFAYLAAGLFLLALLFLWDPECLTTTA